ncbi:MAG: DNA polymerase I [Mogibacterium sp.]|nr:DNA polymerase I [Mogibacterium sp.]
MEQLILIDGNSLLFRAFFAMRPMVTSKGIHTQGVFAFVNMLNKIIKDYKPDYIAVAFDMKEKTFRHEQYPEYKAGRLQTPLELLSEIPILHDVLRAMNIAVLEMPRYEADDIIGTLSVKASAEGLRTLVISGDKDELQLVDDNVNVLINKKGMSEFDLYDLAAMKERYNLTPQQFIDLKALMGDKSDNIPGIAGIGEKKGIALLEQYGDLENVIANSDKIPGKMGENVRNGIESARLSKWLATINTDAPVEFTWDDLKYTAPDIKALIEIYTELEFNAFIRRLQSENPDAGPEEEAAPAAFDAAAEIGSISKVSLEAFLESVEDGSIVITEASVNADHIDTPEISAIALYSPEKNMMCIREMTPMDASLCIDSIAAKSYKLCGCGLKKIIYTMMSYTDTDPDPYYDVQVAEYLLDPNRQKYALDKMLLRYNGYAVSEEDRNIMSETLNDESFALTAVDLARRAYFISKVMPSQDAALAENGLKDLFHKCEMPLVLTLAGMEKEGIKCDPDILRSIGAELDEKISSLESDIYSLAGKEFNINSPKQLAVILFEDLKIPYPKAKGKTGGYSTAADILEKLRSDHRIVDEVLEYRKVAKLRSTYIDGLITLIGTDGRIRPHFMQTVAATGRLSCTEPNLQNIPIRDDYGRLIRKAFVTSNASDIFTGSDYSQIELRILASLSGDQSLIEDFRNGKDIHRATASRVFDIPEDKVTPLDRTRAKAVNFGVVYGMSGFGLGESLNISRTEGQRYINEYFAKHKAVKEYLDKQIKTGEAEHKVYTYFGRVRQIPEFTSRKFMERELAKRLAMNTPIQGTAADIIKIAMNSVSRELRERSLASRLILQIHDELIVEGPENEADTVREILETCMKGAADLAVELTCDIHSGKTWYELK